MNLMCFFMLVSTALFSSPTIPIHCPGSESLKSATPHLLFCTGKGIWRVTDKECQFQSDDKTINVFIGDGVLLDAMLTRDDSLAVLTSHGVSLVQFVNGTLEKKVLYSSQEKSQEYLYLVCVLKETVWLWGSSSLDLVTSDEVILSLPRKLFGCGDDAISFVYSDGLGSSYYFLTISPGAKYKYFVLDQKNRSWLPIEESYDTQAPLFFCSESIFRLDGTQSPLLFKGPQFIEAWSKETMHSLRNLYHIIRDGLFLSQVGRKRAGTNIVICDLRRGVLWKEISQESASISLCTDGSRMYYWPSRLSIQDVVSIVFSSEPSLLLKESELGH